MSISNRPKTLREVDRIAAGINAICETDLADGVKKVEAAATKIAADIYLIWIEGHNPETMKDFFLMIGEQSGRRPVTKLVNYCVREIPPQYRGIVQEVKNEICSTVEMLITDWKPPRKPTFEEVLQQIAEISKALGIYELHRRWLTRMSNEARAKKREREGFENLGRQAAKEKAAAEANMTLEQYSEWQASKEEQKKREAIEECLELMANDGTLVSATPDDLKHGAIYIVHNKRLYRLSDNDTKRLLDCVVGSTR